jgi:hypothetical protein
MKKRTLFFDSPVTNDWLFWLFVVFSGSGLLNAIVDYNGARINTFNAVAITIDIIFVVLITWVILVLPISLIRSLMRRKK